ncbi:MAG: sialate O-acetylesterase [Verrucomicrobiota bacterium]
MKINLEKYAITLFFLLLSNSLLASPFRFHPVFSDDMVLQREKPVAVFGFGKPGTEISVEFKGATKKTAVLPEGSWKVLLPPLPASAEGSVLTATSENESISCKNVLVGDVWFCSGQSNMERPFSTFSELKLVVPTLGRPLVRIYCTAQEPSPHPLEVPMIPTKKNESDTNLWHPSTPEFLINFSPIAYFFAEKTSDELKIPIGMVVSARGATQIECWIPQETLDALHLNIEFQIASKNPPPHEPAVLYNSMIHPFLNLTLKGFLWYQGESNSKWPENYKKTFPALIQGWREKFQALEDPFYFVQIAPYHPLPWDLTKGEAWAWIREAQMSALALPKTGMTVITDLGEYEDIHPQSKKAAGERLALFALRDAGLPVQPESPLFDSMEIKGNRSLLRFKNAASGLEIRRVVMNKKKEQPIQKDPEAFVVEPDQIRGFTLCGEDQKFVDAQANIVGDHLEVWSDSVPYPIAVRYGWKSFPLCNLFGKEGLPVSPFRTDSFPMPTLFQEKTPE